MTSWQLRKKLYHISGFEGIMIKHFGKICVISNAWSYQEDAEIYFIINQYGDIEYCSREGYEDVTDDDINAVKQWIAGRKWAIK